MSFTGDPFKHTEMLFRPEQFESTLWNGNRRIYSRGFAWECSSCGAESEKAWPGTAAIHALVTDFHNHVRTSHKLTPEDTKGWS